jgi:hypothetical protein
VKYWPAPDFFSAAFFSSRPSYRLPRPSSRAKNQSSLSMAVVRALRFAGLRSFVLASAKMARMVGSRVFLVSPRSSSRRR